jgi:hypothetical protein
MGSLATAPSVASRSRPRTVRTLSVPGWAPIAAVLDLVKGARCARPSLDAPSLRAPSVRPHARPTCPGFAAVPGLALSPSASRRACGGRRGEVRDGRETGTGRRARVEGGRSVGRLKPLRSGACTPVGAAKGSDGRDRGPARDGQRPHRPREALRPKAPICSADGSNRTRPKSHPGRGPRCR